MPKESFEYFLDSCQSCLFMYFLVFHNNANSQDSAKSIIDKYGSLNLLINASGVLSIPNAMQPGILFLCFVLINLSILDWTLLRLIMMKQIKWSFPFFELWNWWSESFIFSLFSVQKQHWVRCRDHPCFLLMISMLLVQFWLLRCGILVSAMLQAKRTISVSFLLQQQPFLSNQEFECSTMNILYLMFDRQTSYYPVNV